LTCPVQFLSKEWIKPNLNCWQSNSYCCAMWGSIDGTYGNSARILIKVKLMSNCSAWFRYLRTGVTSNRLCYAQSCSKCARNIIRICHLPDIGGINISRVFFRGRIAGMIAAYVADTIILFLALLSLASAPVLCRYSSGI